MANTAICAEEDDAGEAGESPTIYEQRDVIQREDAEENPDGWNELIRGDGNFAAEFDREDDEPGKSRPSQMSNTLLPTALATAMSPSPIFATAMEPRASGMDVPAATTSVPMTTCGIPMMHPIRRPRTP